MINNSLFTSNTEEWYTPQDFFESCADEVGGFDLDPCATPENTKCEKFYTKEDDGLSKEWFGKVWVNHPYGRQISKWVEKCQRERVRCQIIYLLIPSRTDTKYFHEFIYNKEDVELRFIKGRLKFGGAKNSAPFPSLLAIFHNQKQDE